jgi:hypothetical protein
MPVRQILSRSVRLYGCSLTIVLVAMFGYGLVRGKVTIPPLTLTRLVTGLAGAFIAMVLYTCIRYFIKPETVFRAYDFLDDLAAAALAGALAGYLSLPG